MPGIARFGLGAAVAAALLAPAAPASANACYVGSDDPVLWACGLVLSNACQPLEHSVAQCNLG